MKLITLALLAVAGLYLVAAPTAEAETTDFTKVLVIMDENHSVSQVQAGMPYVMSLAATYGYATNYTAIRHPSLPNYIAMATGQTHGITNDKPPADNEFTGATVFGQAIAMGKTAKSYHETMPTNCRLTGSGKYVVKHNPWAYAVDERTQCGSYDVPFTAFDADVAAGNLPNVGFVSPNQDNNAHNAPLSVADDWFQARMQTIFAGPDWASGNLAVVFTFDEDDSNGVNDVFTMVIHPSRAGQGNVTTALDHYSLSALMSKVTGATPLDNALTAPDMAAAFGLTYPGSGGGGC